MIDATIDCHREMAGSREMEMETESMSKCIGDAIAAISS